MSSCVAPRSGGLLADSAEFAGRTGNVPRGVGGRRWRWRAGDGDAEQRSRPEVTPGAQSGGADGTRSACPCVTCCVM